MTVRVAKEVVAALSEGDGVDPREEKKACHARRTGEKPDYSALRLASQIRDVLNLVIPQFRDPRLASFVAGIVEPCPTGGNFVVQVYSTDTEVDYNPHEIKAILTEMKPRLRAEVAREITRKKTPDFKFDVLPPRVQPK